MTLAELLLSPVYILLLFLILRRSVENKSSPELKKYFRLAFAIKVLSCFLFVIYYTYLTEGDSRSLYFTESHNFSHALLTDARSWRYLIANKVTYDPLYVFSWNGTGYIASPSNFLVIKIATIVSFFTFGQYLLISLAFATFALSGLWKLFMFFYQRKPELSKLLAISVLFFPSVVFWSSGVLKDTLCIGAVGWLTFSLDQIFRGKHIFKSFVWLFVSSYLLIILKIYIILSYVPFLLLFLFLERIMTISSNFLRFSISLMTFLSVIFIFSGVYQSFQEEMGLLAVDNLTNSMSNFSDTFVVMNEIKDAGSAFNLGVEFDGTLSGLIKVFPFAIAATFFRPFIWEADNISQMLASLESIALLFFTLKLVFKAGVMKLFKFYLSDPIIFFCISFAIIFGLMVGTITLNFGTLVRYKIPCLPFYGVALALLYQRVNQKKKEKKSGFEQFPAIQKNE